MNKLLHYIACLSIMLLCKEASGQAPPNDHCENAQEIVIPGGGFDYDTISSLPVNVHKATRQQAEHCAEELEENGNCVKTVWYKFYLPTPRNVGIRLTQQDSAIPQIFSGFNIYRIKDCSYTLSDFANQLTPLNKFGTSGNTCLAQGWYLVQVGCKQKAKGELWVDLEVSKPASEKYDDISGFFDFNLSPNNNKRFNMECASIEKSEALILADSNFTRSVWFSFTVFPNSEQTSVSISGQVKYRIFYDNLHPDSINSTKPFIYLPQSAYILSENCSRINTTRKYYVQMVSGNNMPYADASFLSRVLPKDAWNTPNTNEVVTTKANAFVELTAHTLNCDSRLETHSCKNAVPNFFVKTRNDQYNHGKTITDTFAYAGYSIIKVTEEGLLVLDNYNNFHGNEFVFALYKGDIRTSCQLTYVTDSMLTDYRDLSICASTGTYTLVMAGKKPGLQSAYIRVFLHTWNLNTPNSYPANPEKLPDYKPADRQQVYSEMTGFRNQDTTITISNMTFRGAFVYRELYISESGELEIGINYDGTKHAGYGNMHIFSGQISKGNINAMPGLDYKRFYRSTGDMAQYVGGHEKCFHLAKGHYTIISWVEFRPQYDKLLPCLLRNNQLYIRPISVCPAYTNTEPQFAIPLHKGRSVFDTIPKSFSYTYRYPLISCNFCGTKSQFKPFTSCRHKTNLSPLTTFHYYTFYIDENASFEINVSGYELYEGDALKNPYILKDTGRIIGPCQNGLQICNLEGKKTYTLVILDQTNSTGYYVSFSKLRSSANDYADHAHDMGHVSNDTFRSPFFPITCHTNGSASDPAPPGRYAVPGIAEFIPFPDSLNLKRKIPSRQNLWYTFTASGSSEITLRLTSFPNYYYYGESYSAYVLKYNGPYHKDFRDALADNFDSTIKSMEPVVYTQITGNPVVRFTNPGCQDNRYFVLVWRHPRHLSVIMDYSMDFGLEVVSKTASHSSTGDHCHTAISGVYSQAGKYALKADNACHTYGQSIFEEQEDYKIKSTWFKFKVDGLEKFDLKIRNKNGKGLLRYNVYGGTCKAMTKIARQGDRYAYFTLSCMGKGEYYIQAISDMAIAEELEFEVDITDASKAPCKPYDFKYPIAQFTYRGGCHTNDSIIFSNLSTRGDDMEYTWLLNGKAFSTELHPLLFRYDPDILPINDIRLIVLNTAENIRDTFDLQYKKDTTIYQFYIDGLPKYLCTDTLRLKVKTNYPHKLNYSWVDYRNNLLSTSTNFKENYVFNGWSYYLYGESDNCHFLDSFKVNVIRSLKRYRDTTVCSWGPIVIKSENKTVPYFIYWLNNGKTEYTSIKEDESFTPSKSDTYFINYVEDRCSYVDTMKLVIEPGNKYLNVAENIYACNVTSRKLEYLKDTLLSYRWNTGDTGRFIDPSKSGLYNLRGPFSRCSNLNYTVNLTLEKVNTDILRDTVVCKYDHFPFTNPLGPKFNIRYKEPQADTLHVTGPVKRVLRLQRGECYVADSAGTDIFPFAGKTIDSFYCDEKLKFSMYLNGGDAQKYYWFKNNNDKRFLQIFGYGNYPVARIDNFGCNDTLNFNVITNCEFTIFVPTAFSPNDDYNNETFGPVISGLYSNFKMTLFNNWGEVVFRTDINEQWDGRYKGTFTQGVYCYLITVFDKDGKPYEFKGTVTLLN